MSGDQVEALPSAWGVAEGYWDISGNYHDVPGETVRSVLSAMGAGTHSPSGEAPLVTVDHGDRASWPALPPGRLELEDGRVLQTDGAEGLVLADLDVPIGYHHFFAHDGTVQLSVAVCPLQCPAPPDGRTWGWSVQLYAARSEQSWGMGDFADLCRLVAWARSRGAGFVLVNPLHAPAPGPVPAASPYSPSSRCFLNPLYLRVEDVPGAEDLPGLNELAEKGRALNKERLIDRSRVWALKSSALEQLFAGSGPPPEAFTSFVQSRGQVLDGYTTFCALAETFGLPWSDWPEEYRHPGRPAVAEFAATMEGSERKRYHAWLQWLCELQLSAASEGAGVMFDLAVGADGGGADAWLWQDCFALDMRVGAPPDDFNPTGQDWGLPPLDPWKLRAASYSPYIEMLRAVLRRAWGLRVDHVMGLSRLFWVPLGQEASRGTYVRYEWRDMVRLLRLEAAKAGTIVVGEDLGTVEDHLREILADSGVLSYKLFWFEPKPPGEWPRQALGAITTHDLPTLAGAWTGADSEAQKRAGLTVNDESCVALHRRIAEWTGSPDDLPVEEAIDATYASLATAPCWLRVAVLDDALAVEERPNMPGTIDQWPNWCLALPLTLEQIEELPLAAAIGRHLSEN